MKKIIPYILITLLLIGGIGFTTYAYISKNNDKKDITPDDSNPNPTPSITLSEEELTKYLRYVPLSPDEYNVYKKANNLNNIPIASLINYALYVIGSTDSLEDLFQNTYTIPEYPDLKFDIKYSLSDIKKLLKEMYNLDNISLKNFTLENGSPKTQYTNGTFDFVYYNNYFYGTTICLECIHNHLSSIEKYETTEDELIIYEKSAYYYYGEMGSNNCTDPNTINDYIKNYKIEVPHEIDEDGFCKYEENFNEKTYFKENKSNFTTYKHTFKKNNQSYYWYSTELAN